VRRGLLLLLAVAFLLAGCGGGEEAEEPTNTATARIYFLMDGKVWPVARELDGTEGVELSVLAALAEGPTEDEREALGLTTEVSEETFERSIDDSGRPTIELSDEASDAALAQIVYSLSQLPGLQEVDLRGKTYTRADFEDQTPAILVESPLAFEEVTSPLRVTGTANTFEATFQYELTDTDGRIVDEDFVSATSGTGTRGTFEFTTDDFTVPFDGIGALIVYELSAEDGTTRMHLREIPLKMSR
jgi:hypothetical protein